MTRTLQSDRTILHAVSRVLSHVIFKVWLTHFFLFFSFFFGVLKLAGRRTGSRRSVFHQTSYKLDSRKVIVRGHFFFSCDSLNTWPQVRGHRALGITRNTGNKRAAFLTESVRRWAAHSSVSLSGCVLLWKRERQRKKKLWVQGSRCWGKHPDAMLFSCGNAASSSSCSWCIDLTAAWFHGTAKKPLAVSVNWNGTVSPTLLFH